MEQERERTPRESDDVLANTEGGDPGVTRESVAKARQANPEQAPGWPQEPPTRNPNEQEDPDEGDIRENEIKDDQRRT